MRWMVVLGMLGGSVTAHAQNPTEAMKLFEEGRAHARDNDWATACDKFSKSMELDRASGTELNLGDCEEHMGHFARAFALFTEAAELSLKDQNDQRAKVARDRADALVGKLATVVVRLAEPSAPDLQVMIAGRIVAPAAEIKERVDPGPVEVVVTAPGKPKFERTQDVAAGATAIFDSSTGGAVEPAQEHHYKLVRDRTRVHVAMGLGAGAGVSAIVSIGLGVVARSSYNSTIGNPMLCMQGPRCTQQGVDQVNHAFLLADIGTGFGMAAVALGIAGGVVWLTAPEVMISPTASRDGAGVSIAGRF